jgi:hypothetical protein
MQVLGRTMQDASLRGRVAVMLDARMVMDDLRLSLRLRKWLTLHDRCSTLVTIHRIL